MFRVQRFGHDFTIQALNPLIYAAFGAIRLHVTNPWIHGIKNSNSGRRAGTQTRAMRNQRPLWALFWVAVKELKFSSILGEPYLLTTMYTYITIMAT